MLHKETLVPGAALSACTHSTLGSSGCAPGGWAALFSGNFGGKQCAESTVLMWESQALARPELPAELA